MLQQPTPRRLGAWLSGTAVAATAVLAACTDAPTAAPAASAPAVRAALAGNASYNDLRVYVHLPIVNPCAPSGREIVPLDGVEHASYQTVIGPDGSARVRVHVNAQGVTGYGVVSGDLYRSSGATNEAYEWDAAQNPTGNDITYGFNVEDVSHPGRAGNIHVTETVHVDVDAFGYPNLHVSKFDAVCKS
jgi:hypothetical protein